MLAPIHVVRDLEPDRDSSSAQESSSCWHRTLSNGRYGFTGSAQILGRSCALLKSRSHLGSLCLRLLVCIHLSDHQFAAHPLAWPADTVQRFPECRLPVHDVGDRRIQLHRRGQQLLPLQEKLTFLGLNGVMQRALESETYVCPSQ